MLAERALKEQNFGRRKGRRLRPHRQNLMEELLPRLSLSADETIKPFGDYRSYALEIGFGNGEHLAALAKQSPDTGFIGCEVFINGIASLLADIDRYELPNIRIFADDARKLLPLAERGFFDAVYLLFPDPWHKKRHAKRRLLQKASVPQFAHIIKPQGEFYIASDNHLYIRHALNCLADSPFQWLAEQPADWQNPPHHHIRTRYETKALQAGHKPIYLHYRKSASAE